MYTKYPNGIITINKADTFIFETFLNIGTPWNKNNYILKNDDCAYLGVMEPNQEFNNSLIRKKLDKTNMTEDGKLAVEFNAIDTANLLPGIYYYELKIKYTNDLNTECICTVIPKTIFNIRE